MNYLRPTYTNSNMRYDIICPEPIKFPTTRVLPESRWTPYNDEYNCNDSDFSDYSQEASPILQTDNYMYPGDPDMEAQEELMMIVKSPKSTTPVSEPIQRSHFVPMNNDHNDLWTLPAICGTFSDRRRRSQSVNDGYLISTF